MRASDPSRLRSDRAAMEGLELFREATTLDPTFAATFAGLARMYLRVSAPDGPELSRVEGLRLTEEAASRAIVLDASLADAYGVLALVRMASYDPTAAEAALDRAIELDPGRALFREWRVGLYILTERAAEALAEARRAVGIDTLSASANAELARAYMVNGRCDEALEILDELLDLRPPILRAAPIAAH